jgi:hypothetical protein
MLHAGKEDFRFQLHRTSKKLARASPQDIGQGIVNFTGLTKANNADSLVHCEFRFNPAGDSDLKSATVPI